MGRRDGMEPKKTFASRRAATRRLAFASVGCALQVILLYLGALLDVLDISVAALAAFVNVWAVIELRGAWPWLMWGVTSAVSLLLLPAKSPAVLYLLLAGYYPMIKSLLEKCHIVLSWVLKILIFNVAMTLTILACMKLLGMSGDFEGIVLPLFYVIGNPAFVLFDVAATRLITAYLRVWRQKLHINV